MFSKLFKLVERHLTWIQLITGTSLVSVVGWISREIALHTKWIVAAGPYAIWLATLLGALLFVLLCLGIAWFRYAWTKASAMQMWKERVTTINPLDAEFNKERIEIANIISPINHKIADKRFINCELLGPANITFMSNNDIHNAKFERCDVCVVKAGVTSQGNIVPFDGVQIIGGSIANCTIFITPDMVQQFLQMGAQFLTFTGDSEVHE